MTVLSIRTDKPEAEVGLWDNSNKMDYETWYAHRELAATFNRKVEELLNKSSISYKQLQGIVIFKGPGSFTGLRIGMSVANALAYSLQIPIVSTAGKDWIEDGIKKLSSGAADKIALPEYGGPPKTTSPR